MCWRDVTINSNSMFTEEEHIQLFSLMGPWALPNVRLCFCGGTGVSLEFADVSCLAIDIVWLIFGACTASDCGCRVLCKHTHIAQETLEIRWQSCRYSNFFFVSSGTFNVFRCPSRACSFFSVIAPESRVSLGFAYSTKPVKFGLGVAK